MNTFFQKTLFLFIGIFIVFSTSAQLSGTYTIDKTKSGTKNYKTFKAAVGALNSSGVSGAVRFKVADDVYNESVLFNFVSGASATNTITFEGTDSSKAILSYACSQYEAVVKFNAASHFVFKNMTILSTGATTGYGIHVTSGAENISLSNCVIKTADGIVGANCIPVNIAGATYSSVGSNGQNVRISKSVISGGYFGVNIRGANSSLLSKKFLFDQVEIKKQYVYGVYASFAEDIELTNSSIDSTGIYYAYGIYTTQCSGGQFSNNKIYVGRYAMYLSLHNYYNRSDSVVIRNNEIADFDDPSYQIGVYSASCYNVYAYHNTILCKGTVSSFTYPTMYFTSPNNHRILNNNLKASRNSSVFYMGAGTLGTTKVNFNNFHAGSNGGLISWQGTTYNKLSDLKAAVSSQNQNSKQENPRFTTDRNLIPTNPGINNRAKKHLASKDLAGNTRPLAPDNTPDIGAYEYYIDPVDIDLVSIPKPLIADLGQNVVAVNIKNNGSTRYSDSVFVKYRIDKGTWISDTAVFTSLKLGEVSTFEFTKKWNIATSGSYDLCVVIHPIIAGDPDSLVGDTICQTKCVGRSGKFVIDWQGSGDYTSFSDAISSLACGIAGPITFEVKPGIYRERLEIPETLGASRKNIVTFDGLDKTDVTLEYTGTTALPSNILLDEADYLHFKNLKIVNKGTQVANGFWLRGDAHHIKIMDCDIRLDSVAVSYAHTGILIANSVSSSGVIIPGNKSNNVTIKNNTIRGGSFGMRVNGIGNSSTSDSIRVINNSFSTFYYQGINAVYINSSRIADNKIKNPRLYTAYGMYLYYNENDSIEGNYIEGGRFGVYMYGENLFGKSTFSSFANNMITGLTDPNYQIGLMAATCHNLTVYHNSVYTNGRFTTNPYYASMNIYYCQNSFVKNNSIQSGVGTCFAKYYGNIASGSIDNNNYYSVGLAKYYHDGFSFADLASWKTIKSKFNQNSKEGNPNYFSTKNLHSSGTQLNNEGQKGLGIGEDYDGQSRPIFPDKKPDIGADEYYVSPYDIDLVSLDSPAVAILGDNTVIIGLRNTGIKALDNDTVVVSYSVDGVFHLRDTVIISALAPNETYQHTFTQKWKVASSKTYNFCTKLDTFFKPDPDSLVKQEICINTCPGAKGTYVIDRKGGGDFKTFRGAVRALNCGINGPVTFLVKDGQYIERLKLGEIIGASSQNTIKFVGESKSGVKMLYLGRLDSMEVIHLEGADHFTFKNMTLQNTSAIYSRGIRISNVADYNNFINCDIVLPTTAVNGYCMSVFISDQGLPTLSSIPGNYNVFENCSFANGYYGVRAYGGGTTSLAYGNEFNNCSFTNHRVYSIYAFYLGQLKIDGCSFEKAQLKNYQQLYIYGCSESQIHNNDIQSGKFGLYLRYENYYFQENASSVTNNRISNQDNATDNIAADFYYNYNTSILHNSFLLNNSSAGTAVSLLYGSGYDFRNNSLSKTTNGSLFVTNLASFSYLDYNNYYAGSTSNFITYNNTSYSNLTAWKTALSGFNRNSKEGDPGYKSASDLRIDPKSSQLANWAIPIASVSKDFEGDIRNPLTPDVGADEYSAAYDIGISSILLPTNGCELSSTEDVSVYVKNYGTVSLPNNLLIPLSYQVDGNTATIDTFLTTAAINSGDSVLFKFASTADFTSFKTYSLACKTLLGNDPTASNDELIKKRKSFENPKAAFTSSNNCSEEDVLFSDKSTVGTSTISAYTWDFGNGKTSSLASPKSDFVTSGSYDIKLVVESAQGCKDSLTKSLTIESKPTAKFTASQFCAGDSTKFINSSSIATATGASFAWDFDDGNSSTKRNPKNEYAANGSYQVVQIATSANGCSDTTTQTISISANPVASFSRTTECLGDSTNFTNLSTIPAGTTASYTWTYGDGNGHSKKQKNYLYGGIGTYKAELKVTLANGCTDQTSKNIKIFSKPNPVFSVADGCYGDSSRFQDASTIQLDTIQSYAWDFDDGNSSSKTSPSHFYKNPGSYDVELTLVSIKGCALSVTNTIDIFDKPTANFSVNNSCEGTESSFTNSSTITTGTINSNAWTFGDGFSSSDKDPDHSYSVAGSFSAQLIAESGKGCSDTMIKSLAIYPSPEADFTASNVCFGTSLSPVNKSSISSGTISSYAWDFDDGNSSTSTNPSNTYTAKGKYDIELIVTSNFSCKDTITREVIVDSKVAPGFTVDPVCLGDSTRFANTTNISCGSVISYLWEFGDSKTSTLIDPAHMYSSAGNYTVKLTVFSAGGIKDVFSKSVEVYRVPNSNFSASNACQDASASFTNLSSISSGSITGTEWLFGDGAKSNIPSASHVYTKDGSYTVSLISVSNKGCRDTIDKSITIYELPGISFSASNVCEGSSVSFTNASSIGTGSLSYAWEFGDGFGSSQKAPKYTYSSAGSYMVKLAATSSNGCKNIDSNALEIYQNPSSDFSAAAQCANLPISFLNKSTISTGTLSYLWRFGDGRKSTAINPSYKYASAGSYLATVISTSINGCIDSISKNIASLPTPIANFAIPSPCSGTNVSFSNSSTLSSGTLSSDWNFGDGKSSSNTSPTHSYGLTGSYSVKLLVTASSGCKDSITQTAKIYDLPAVSFSSTGSCLSDSIVYDNTSTIASGTMTYTWDLGDGTNSTKEDLKHQYKTAGSYLVKLVAISSTGSCKDSSTQTVIVNASPALAFTANSACLGDQTDISNSSTVSSGTISYFWDLGNGQASAKKNPSLTYSNFGTYDIKLNAITSAGCKDSLVKQIAINENPSAAFSYGAHCLGDTTQFSDLGSMTSGTWTNTWDFGDGNSSSSKSPSYDYKTVGSFSVKLKSTSDKGCQDSVLRMISINPVVANSFSLTNNCDTDSSRFYNTSTLSSGTFSSAWDFGDANTSTTLDASHLYAAYGNYLVQLTTTTDSACVSQSDATIYVHPLPLAAFSFMDTCLSDSLRYANISSISQGSFSGFKWDFDDGSSSTDISPWHQFAADGTYNVELIAISDSGCTDTIQIKSTPDPLPEASFSYLATCLDKDVNFGNTSSSLDGFSAFLWIINGKDSLSDANPSFRFTDKGPHQIILETKSNGNCLDSVHQTIHFNSVPEASFTFADQCERDSFGFQNTSILTTGKAKYAWDFGDGHTATKKNSQNHFDSAKTYTVQLIVSSPLGCNDTATAQVSPLARPVIAFSAAQFCLGDSSQFTNASTSANPLTFVWDFGDASATSPRRDPNHLYASSGTYRVHLTADDGLCSDSLSQIFTILEGPANLSIAFSDTCVRNTITFSAEHDENNNLTYDWRFYDGSTATGKTTQKYYGQNGKFAVGLYVSEGSCFDSIFDEVTIHPLADSSFTFSSDGKRDVVLTANDPAASSYVWDFGDGATDNSNTSNPMHNYAEDGTYTVTLTVTNSLGCSSTSSQEITVTGIGISWNSSELSDLSVYPNPFQSSAQIEYSIERRSAVQIEIYDEMGRLIHTTFQGKKEAGNHQHLLLTNGNQLSSGVYYVNVRINQSFRTLKLVKID